MFCIENSLHEEASSFFQKIHCLQTISCSSTFFSLPKVKMMYRKLTNEMSSLKNLWIMTLGIPEEMESYESTMTENYMKAKQLVRLSSALFTHGVTNDIHGSLLSQFWPQSFRTSLLEL